MIRALVAVGSVIALSVVAACSGGSTCTGDGCPSVEGSQSSSGSSGQTTNPTEPGSTSGSGTTTPNDKTCYGSASSCWCGDLAVTMSDSKVASCSRSSGATFCCQTNDFPSAGSCFCSDTPPSCAESQFGDTCTCSLAGPTAGDKAVDSCAAKAGGICCAEPSELAPSCTCFDGLTSCPEGGTPVSSCTASQLPCSDKSVTSCSY